ncbi:hypothetical protein HDU76_009140 [Blyttiomyces sp. JEL0837]|nr:hypothetical protein HDU76_009140 [Blyttiomyces sp. JEL0837]
MATATVSLLMGTANTFYTIFNVLQQSKANKRTFGVLRDRIKCLVTGVASICEDEAACGRAMQALKDLIRRLNAAIATAVLLVEQQESASSMMRMLRAVDFANRLNAVNSELTSCSADLTLIMSMAVFANDKDSRTSQEARSQIAIAQALGEEWETAKAEDSSETNAFFDKLEREVAQLKTTQDRDTVSLHQQMSQESEAIQRQLTEVERSILKHQNRMLVTSATLVDPSKVRDYVEIFKDTRNVIFKCVYVKEGDKGSTESLKLVCAYKAVNSGRQMVVGYREAGSIEKELIALSKLRTFPYFPTLYGTLQRDITSTGLLMEFVQGPQEYQDGVTLKKYLSENVVEWSVRIRFIKQLSSALAYMHRAGIVHGGIRSADILVGYEPDMHFEFIKIIDFERSMMVNADTVRLPTDLLSNLAYHPYTAPELFTSAGFPSYATDIFAAGTVLWELAYCATPYSFISQDAVKDRIVSGQRDIVPQGPYDGAPRDLAGAIEACWSQEPTNRPTAASLDEMLFEVYRPNLATAASRRIPKGVPGDPGIPNTPERWRDEHLRIRSGLSKDDLASIRMLALFLMDERFPSTYWYAGLQNGAQAAESRRKEAITWLRVAADKYESGGAAYDLAQLHGGAETEEGREWLKKARAFGHPKSTLDIAKWEYKNKRSISREDYEKIGRTMEDLVKLRDNLIRDKLVQRRSVGLDERSLTMQEVS